METIEMKKKFVSNTVIPKITRHNKVISQVITHQNSRFLTEVARPKKVNYLANERIKYEAAFNKTFEKRKLVFIKTRLKKIDLQSATTTHKDISLHLTIKGNRSLSNSQIQPSTTQRQKERICQKSVVTPLNNKSKTQNRPIIEKTKTLEKSQKLKIPRNPQFEKIKEKKEFSLNSKIFRTRPDFDKPKDADETEDEITETTEDTIDEVPRYQAISPSNQTSLDYIIKLVSFFHPVVRPKWCLYTSQRILEELLVFGDDVTVWRGGILTVIGLYNTQKIVDVLMQSIAVSYEIKRNALLMRKIKTFLEEIRCGSLKGKKTFETLNKEKVHFWGVTQDITLCRYIYEVGVGMFYLYIQNSMLDVALQTFAFCYSYEEKEKFLRMRMNLYLNKLD
ncbi:hypothetical protein EIN_264870 [Entamoeba invadens IP1]|uniref:Uncharacterized protein n=1 Tax=Entamoeba invadens IP1 TaxID=370355 RepID=A0A0A1TZT0_ENTIV|nr:hypothetical protein EIN_264870 [Entamoeba invadens IP1]ELP85700.1 hypothetical protein EIN_264870 [Entamoeba invadens IP1]|eukprot:XP_004185046.1 hypothetical protein EIN_264870 [Entamoeba invadens IP1]